MRAVGLAAAVAGLCALTSGAIPDARQTASQAATSGLSTLLQYRLPGGASRLAALLVAQISPIFSLLTPCDPGAARRQSVLNQRGRATSDQQPTFRGSVNAVTVDVSIRDKSRRAVTGLTAKDFQVFDNGVLQTVDNVSFGRLPIDVTVALDISHSVSGALLERLRRGVIDLMDDLRKEDRLKLVLFNMRVNRTVDFTSDVREVERALKGVTGGGGTALLDAISVALIAARQPDRRQLIVVFTDGSDSSSSTTPDMLTRVAQRTPGTLTFVLPTVGPAITIRQGDSVTKIGGVRLQPPLASLFRTLATETGGDVLDTGASGDLSATFRRAINDFRSAYVLYYNVRGVDRGGYHTIEVKVAREGATVQARRGYWQ